VPMIELEKSSDILTERLYIDSPLTESIFSDSPNLPGDAPEEILFRLKGVTKTFDGGTVGLEKVNFCMKKGEWVSLVGPNQSGKTTLLRLIAFEEKPTRGEIVFNGLSSRDLKKSQIPLWRRKLGLILDDLELINDLSIFENVALSLRILGKSEKKIRQQVRQTLNMVGLSAKSRSLPAELSSAEYRKVTIARAIVRNPLLLLADEPTRNLDERGTKEITELFIKINLFGTAVLLTSRESSPGNGFPGRVINMENGKAIENDSFLSMDLPVKPAVESALKELERAAV
jgi:cell division transport system ATP-binding protein